MAEEQVIISVDLDAGQLEQQLEKVTADLVTLKDQQRALTQEFKAGEISAQEYSIRSKSLSQEISTLSRQQGNLTQAVKLTTTATKDYGDSLDGERAKLNDMQKAFAALSKEQRESAAGQEFLKSIKEQSDAVKAMESSMGDARRNVGNYADSILQASGQMGGFGKATSAIINPIKGATNGLKAMSATPIIAILNILITIIVKLADKFKQNGAAMESLTKTFGLFNGVGVIVSKIIDGIANGVVWLADKLYDLADRFGLISDVAKESARLSNEQLAIQKAENELIAETADRELKISELRAKVAEKNKYTAQQRLDFLKEAQRLEREQADADYQLAKRRYELQVALNAQSESSQEDLRKENELYAAMVGAQTAYNNKVRELNAQMTEAQNQLQREAKETGDVIVTTTEEVANTEVETEEQRAARIREIREKYGLVTNEEKYNEQLELLKQYHDDELITEEEYLQAVQNLKEKYGIKSETTEEVSTVQDQGIDEMAREMFGVDKELIEYYNELLQSGMDKTKAFELVGKKAANNNRKNFADMAGGMAGVFNQIAGMLNEYGKNNEKASKAAKAFALAGIIADQAKSVSNTAISISEAVAGATKAASATGPAAPFTLPTFIATMVGLVLAQIASTASAFMQAKQLLSGADTDAGAFEQGGIVGGTSYTGDKLTVRANSREMILTQRQQARLFDIANTPAAIGGIDYEALAAAMAALPAPVMDYTEFRQFEQQVSTYNEFASV